MTQNTHYAEQSVVTDPGRMEDRIEGVGRDPAALRRMVGGLLVHYRDPGLAGYGIAEERRAEIDTRYAERMLARLRELDAAPLGEERPHANRLVGCCRDFTVMYVMLLRAAGIPARSRVGFAGYLAADWWIDHVVAEVWDAAEGRWRLVDAQLGDAHDRPHGGEPFSTLDVPRDLFLTGPAAWTAARTGEEDPERFVVSPDLDLPFLRSWFYLRHNLVQDLAALDKREMLLWDTWGLLGLEPSTPEEEALLDRVGAVTGAPDPTPADLAALYAAEPRLRVPQVVLSINPLDGAMREVDVAAVAR
jgi:hypothetical protein